MPYRGGLPALQSVLAGDTNFYFDTPTTALGYIKGGTLTALAVSTLKRSPDLPMVPSLAEQGFAGFDAATWFGLVAPAGTNSKIVARLNREMVAALAMPKTLERLRRAGFQVELSTPEELGRLIASDFSKWRTIVQNAKLTLD